MKREAHQLSVSIDRAAADAYDFLSVASEVGIGPLGCVGEGPATCRCPNAGDHGIEGELHERQQRSGYKKHPDHRITTKPAG